ncbi:hypothetical protein COOONC_12961 [Cooperia oncophora]
MKKVYVVYIVRNNFLSIVYGPDERTAMSYILPTGELRVEHSPIIKLPSFLGRRRPPKGLLNIRLAGVDMSEAGQQFISKDLRLKNKPIVFTVIKGSENSTDAVDADVTVKKSAFSQTNLNIEVVRRGYARVPPPESPRHLKALQSIPAYSRLINRLLMSEKVCEPICSC